MGEFPRRWKGLSLWVSTREHEMPQAAGSMAAFWRQSPLRNLQRRQLPPTLSWQV